MHKLTPRIQRYLTFSATNGTHEYKWLGKIRWNEKRLDRLVLELLESDLTEYNARAIHNLVERDLLARANEIAKCLVEQSRYTHEKGWLWDGINLLEDVKVEDVDDSHYFTVIIGSDKANVCGRVSRRKPKAKSAPPPPAGGAGAGEGGELKQGGAGGVEVGVQAEL